MKKSKVLIPAMALLLFSTAASITGTVAWFTSTRVFTMNAGQFEVAQLDGNLDVKVEAGVGTELGTGSEKTVKLASKTRLVDTSVDLTGNAWRLNAEGGDKYADLGLSTAQPHKWLVKTLDGGTDNERNYYAAVTWKLTIKYSFASEKGDMGIYLDLKKSQFENIIAATDGTPATPLTGSDSSKGFRIMFHDDTNSKATVWGNHIADLDATGLAEYSPYDETKNTPYAEGAKVIYEKATYVCKAGGTGAFEEGQTAVGSFDPTKWQADFKSTLGVINKTVPESPVPSPINLKYVSGGNATTDYVITDNTANPKVKGNYVTSVDESTGTYNRIEDGTENAATLPERIATISKATADAAADKSASVVVTCIAWFEGTDPNIVNGTAMKALSAKMTFYARCDSVTAPANNG